MPQRGIATEVWTHPEFSQLSPEAKLLYLYCITSSRGNQAGVYRATERQIAFDTGLDAARVGALFSELVPLDVEWHPDSSTIVVLNFIRHQSHNPAFLQKAGHCLDHGIEPSIVAHLVQHYAAQGVVIPTTCHLDIEAPQTDHRPTTVVPQTARVSGQVRPESETVSESETGSEGESERGTDPELDAPDGAPAPAPGELPEMTPLEDELHNLQAWGEFTMDDRRWLEELLRDYPGALERDIRDCRDHWMSHAKKHSRNEWKRRFRTWMRRKKDFPGGGNGHTTRGLPGNQYGGALSQFETQFKD